MRPAESPPPDAAEKGAKYAAGAAAAMQRIGASMTFLGLAADVKAQAGSWEHDHAALEQYSSLADVHAFWDSPEYTEARPHRAALVQMHFVVAVPGVVASPEEAGGFAVAFGDIQPSGAGIVLADADVSDLAVLEGDWPYDGRIVIEAHRSLADAEAAWTGRDGLAAAIALPATPRAPGGGSR
jgi:uncharacterized protein (DUF1330 family)